MTAQVAEPAALSHNPRTGATVEGPAHTSQVDLARLLTLAPEAAPVVATASSRDWQGWLEAVAVALEANADSLVSLADAETALGRDVTTLQPGLATARQVAWTTPDVGGW